MTLVRWNPSATLAGMEIDRLNQMFSDFQTEAFTQAGCRPVDIYETDEPRGRDQGGTAGHEA